MRKRRLLSALVPLLAVAAAGCGSGDDESGRLPGDKVTIYSSLPAHGVSAPAARAVAAGQRLALRDAGRRVGGRRVRLVTLDSTVAGGRIWEPDEVSANAKRAADDPTTIAYLGELDYGASAVSLPITNSEGILQVSPGDGLTSLTQTPPGRPRAGPERYYPEERRSFLRLVPTDLREADLLLSRARATGSRRTAIVYDEHIYGRELAGQLGSRLRRDKAEVAESEELPSDPVAARSVADKVVESRSDAVILAGVAGTSTAPFLAELARLRPDIPVFATSGILARQAPLPAAPRQVEAITPLLPPSRLPAAGRRLLRRVARATGPAAARPEAVLGYASMQIALDALRDGGPSRERVVREALTTRERTTPAGDLLIRRTGDIEGGHFALYRLRGGGRFSFERDLP